ncbi:MAG: molybdenum cofactor guanylyltransferase [Leptospiraceae bacterium]|nr:molybdenum cofactor guanylyltransferase [Leptospiraceae bacterium]MCP5494376.1 molybdenum cofactor guanylyltransferase [Leptospiraceae bacterium]
MRLKIKYLNQISRLFGIVLCGGSSSRMGSDKGLIQKNGKTWGEYCATLLENYAKKVIISINEKQYFKYHFLLQKYEFVADSIKLRGPLAGLLSVHLVYPGSSFLVLACDMIDMDSVILNKLIDAYKKNKGYDFYVFRNLNHIEPLCGIYKPEGLRKALNSLFTGEMKDNSIQYMLSNGNTLFLDLDEEDIKYFHSYNSQLDLA